MANKKSPGPESPAMAEQQPGTPAQHIEVGQLRMKHKTPRAIFAGVCAAQGWKSGKFVTEEEYLEAVEKFTSAPMNGAAKKEARK